MNRTVRHVADSRIVSYGDDGNLPRAVHFAYELEYELAGLIVEISCRLVGKEKRGVFHQRSGNRHSLLLAAGEFAGEVVCALGKPHFRQYLHCVCGMFHEFRHEFDVLTCSEGGDQVEELKDKTDARPAVFGNLIFRHPAEICALEEDAAGGRPVDAADQVQQRRFSRAARPEHDDELSRVDREICRLKREDGHLTHQIGLGGFLEFDQGRLFNLCHRLASGLGLSGRTSTGRASR